MLSPLKIQSDSEITFVIQGIVNEHTLKTIASIHRFFPRSPMILSVHRSNQPRISCDSDKFTYLEIPDPGESKNNLRRQIATSRAGLELVKTPFACKIRSDVEFVHGGLLDAYNTHLPSVPSSAVFEQPVGILDVFTYHPHVLPLFLSDFIAIGLTSDVKEIFNCSLPVKDMDVIVPETNPRVFAGTQIGPEQYLAWSAMGILFNSAKGFSSDAEKEIGYDCLKKEYIVLDITRQAGLIWHKNLHVEQMAERDCLHNEGWKNLC